MAAERQSVSSVALTADDSCAGAEIEGKCALNALQMHRNVEASLSDHMAHFQVSFCVCFKSIKHVDVHFGKQQQPKEHQICNGSKHTFRARVLP